LLEVGARVRQFAHMFQQGGVRHIPILPATVGQHRRKNAGGNMGMSGYMNSPYAVHAISCVPFRTFVNSPH
jgi:hypothetical protein